MSLPACHCQHSVAADRVHARAEFGIGMRSYGIGPNFRGVKMIPAGLHLVTYGTGMERVGVFLQFGAGAGRTRTRARHGGARHNGVLVGDHK